MTRAPSPQPTPGELEILTVLWETGPTELGPLCAALRRQRPMATTTVATMLKVMLDKGLAKRAKGPRGWLWSARATRRATTTRMLKQLVDRVFDGSAGRLVAHLLDQDTLSAEDRRQIRALLESTSDDATVAPPAANSTRRRKT